MARHKKKLLSDFTEEEYRAFKARGLTHDDIAEELLVSRDTVALWVRENGLKGLNNSKTKYSEETRRKMVDLYRSGMRICDVARSIGCSEFAVRYNIEKDKAKNAET